MLSMGKTKVSKMDYKPHHYLARAFLLPNHLIVYSHFPSYSLFMSETTTESVEPADQEDSDIEEFPNATEDKLAIRKKCELEIIAKYDR